MASVRTFEVPDLAAWRRFVGWSQAELAERAGLNVGSVAALEQGKHGIWAPTLASLAAVFGVPRHVLMHEQPEEVWARGWRPPEDVIAPATQERTAASA